MAPGVVGAGLVLPAVAVAVVPGPVSPGSGAVPDVVGTGPGAGSPVAGAVGSGPVPGGEDGGLGDEPPEPVSRRHTKSPAAVVPCTASSSGTSAVIRNVRRAAVAGNHPVEVPVAVVAARAVREPS